MLIHEINDCTQESRKEPGEFLERIRGGLGIARDPRKYAGLELRAVFLQEGGDALRSGLAGGSFELALQGINERIDFDRLDEVIVHLAVDRLQGRLERGIARQNKDGAIGLNMPHAAGHQEPIAFLADIQIGHQCIELKRINLEKGIRDALRNVHFKSCFLQNGRQGETDARFVVHKKHPLASFVFGHRLPLQRAVRSFSSGFRIRFRSAIAFLQA